MKKIISLILVLSMLFSMTTVSFATENELDISDLINGNTSNREELLAEKEQEYVELDLFQDVFATYKERASEDWYAWSEGDITTIWPFKGMSVNQEPQMPFKRTAKTSEYAMMIDIAGGEKTYPNAVDLKTNPKVTYNETLGRYIASAKKVKYKLGEIAEGKLGGNYATLGIYYDTTVNYNIADGLGIKERTLNAEFYPNLDKSHYTSSNNKTQVSTAKYTLNKEGVKEINLLLTQAYVDSKNKDRAVYVPVTITYTDGVNTTKEEIGLVVGGIASSFQNSIYAVPASAGYTTVSDIKTNGVAGNTVAGKDIVNSNVILPQLATRKTYIPDESFILATVMRSYVNGEFDGYVHSFTIPVDSTKTIKSVELSKNTSISTSFFDSSAATIADGTSSSATCLIPIEIEGVEDDYIYYMTSTRNCGAAGIFAMTLGYDSLNDKIADLEERMANAQTGTQAQEIDKDFAELIANTIVEASDFDAAVLAAYEAKKEFFAEQLIEEERQEKLKVRKYTYIDYEKDRDVFASYKDISDLAKFNKSASGSASSTNFNLLTYNHNGTTIFEWLPHERADGTPVTGKEVYYYKGFSNEASSLLPESERGGAKTAGYIYIADDLIEEDGKTLYGKRVNSVSTSSTHSSKDYFDGTLYRVDANRTVKNPSFVQKMDENGYVIIKNGDVQTKIGPVSTTEVKPNAMRLNTTHTIENVNAKGSRLDVVITSSGVNYNSTGYKANTANNYALAISSPTAALQTIKVNYKDGSVASKKMLVVHNLASGATDTAYRSIIFAPKKNAQGNEIVYDAKSFYLESANHSFTALTSKNLSTIGLTSVSQINADTVKFESKDIVYSTTGTIAQGVNNRQDICYSNYGNFTSYASIDLDYKEIESIQMVSSMTSATEDPTAIAISTSNGDTPTLALLPLTIEGASDDYVYFAYCGRVADSSFLMGATVTEYSAKEKIAVAEEAMRNITVNSTLKEAKKALELYNIAVEAPNVVPSKDIDANLYENFMETFNTIKSNIPLTGKLDITYYEGELPRVAAEIINEAEVKDKPYTIMLSFYNEENVMVGKHIVNKTTSGIESEVFDIAIPETAFPENVAKVKGFIWESFSTIKPLTDAADSGKRTAFKVLSIGNSYSQDAHSYLAEIAQDGGFEEIVIGNAFIGGCALSKHYENIVGNKAAYSFQTKVLKDDGTIEKKSTADASLLSCIKAQDWDIITIQQQSFNSSDPTTFTNLQAIIDYVNENKTNRLAKVVWHMTWGYEAEYAEKHSEFKKLFNGESVKMYNAIVSTVNEVIVPNKDISFIIPSGTAVQNVRTTGAFEKISDDGTHMNNIGDYVLGLVWYAKITGKSIDDITFTPNEAPQVAENLDLIKKCVNDALKNPYQITK